MKECLAKIRFLLLLKAKQHHAHCNSTLELEKAQLGFYQAEYPGSETVKIYQRRVELARTDAKLATKSYQALKRVFLLTEPKGTDVSITEEQKLVVSAITEVLESVIDLWGDLSPEAREANPLKDMQTGAILDLFTKLGLGVSTLAQLNTQDAIVIPVRHVKHYKGGHYIVVGEGIHTETNQEMTFYVHRTEKKWYARPTDMFAGVVGAVGMMRFIPMRLARLLTGK